MPKMKRQEKRPIIHRLIAAVLLCFVGICVSQAAVVKDALGTLQKDNTAAGAQTISNTTLTVVSNTNGAIVLLVTIGSPGTGIANDHISSVTGYTFIAALDSVDSTHRSELWGKVGNTTGLQAIAMVFPSTTELNTNVNSVAISVTGANQTGGTTTFANSATLNTTAANPGINITTASSDLAVAVLGTGAVVTGVTPNNTALAACDNTPNPSTCSQYAQAPGASPVTMSWSTIASGSNNTLAGVDIAAVAAASTCGSLALLGVGC